MFACEHAALLELHRARFQQHEHVVAAQRRGHFGRKDVAIVVAEQGVGVAAGQAFELVIDEQVAARAILREHRGRGVVEHLLQPQLAFAQCAFAFVDLHRRGGAVVHGQALVCVGRV